MRARSERCIGGRVPRKPVPVKPPPPASNEPTGFYIRVPPELVPPELAAGIVDLVGTVVDAVRKARATHEAASKHAAKLKRRRRRR